MGYFSRDDDLRYRIAEQVRELSLKDLQKVSQFIDDTCGPKRKKLKHLKAASGTPPKKTRSKRVNKLVRKKDYL